MKAALVHIAFVTLCGVLGFLIVYFIYASSAMAPAWAQLQSALTV